MGGCRKCGECQECLVKWSTILTPGVIRAFDLGQGIFNRPIRFLSSFISMKSTIERYHLGILGYLPDFMILPSGLLRCITIPDLAFCFDFSRHHPGKVLLLNGVLSKQIRKDNSTDTQHALPSGSRSKSSYVPRSVLVWPQPGRIYRRRISNRVDQRNCDGSFSRRLRDNVCNPCLDEGRTAIDRPECEDCEHILCHQVGRRKHGNEEGASQAGETTDERPLCLVPIGEPARSDNIHQCSTVSWDGVILRQNGSALCIIMSTEGHLHCASFPVHPNVSTRVGIKYCIVCAPVTRVNRRHCAHILQSLTVILNATQWGIFSSLPPWAMEMPSIAKRLQARIDSVSSRNLVLSDGKSGKAKNTTMAATTETRPSRTFDCLGSKVSLCAELKGPEALTKSQRHPSRPPVPSIYSVIRPARRPEIAPASGTDV